jgi:uncharacterized membrane protein YqiK
VGTTALYYLIPIVLVVIFLLFVLKRSINIVGPNKVGLVTKTFGKSLPAGKLIAEHGEAGYQPDLLMPGVHIRVWPVYRVRNFDRVQIPPGSIGVVIAQVGEPLDIGAKTAEYKEALGDFSDLRAFVDNGGQRGVQRPVLPPGATLPLHPIAFVVITQGRTFGQPLSESITALSNQLRGTDLQVTEINPEGDQDIVGVVTTLEGKPLPSGDMAGRLGGFDDIQEMESTDPAPDPNEVIQRLLGTMNERHNNYQDFQAFLDAGGRIGLQHDPLLYGVYLLNPFLVSVERVPMLVVEQGEVAVIKSYVGLPTEDTSGEEYKFGSIVRPGHRGIWAEPLRTGKYPLNPRIYDAVKVPTSILTLNWANASSEAHDLDARLSSIDAKSMDAFDFTIDLQVLIHVPDTRAPKVIGMVGTMHNLVNEVLQSAVGNYFRNSLQKLSAIDFIVTREAVQSAAEAYVMDYLGKYDVEVRGCYIQDVVFPRDLVEVLTSREIATQEKTTYTAQMDAQQARVALERQKGVADAQADLARSEVSVEVNHNTAAASIEKAKGDAEVTRQTGSAEADRIEAIGTAEASAIKAKGLATAASYEAQQTAIGREQTAAVAVFEALARGQIKITPDTVVGSGSNSLADLLVTLLTQNVVNGNGSQHELPAAASAASDAQHS